MTIKEALHNEEFSTIRVEYLGRWLTTNGNGGRTVYSQTYRQKKARVLIETDSEEEAVSVLTAFIR